MSTNKSNILALERQQWTIVVNDVNPMGHTALLIRVWKVYANGVAVTVSVRDEQGQFVLYTDLGHSGSGTNRTENGTFSTLDVASIRLIQECKGWDATWET